MDNLSLHKITGVPERIAAAGVEPLYPPYSPDLDHIEKAWANSNNCSALPKPEAHSHSNKPITDLLPAIRPQDAQKWFRIPFHAL
jgi:hypothetical protein